MVYIIISIDYYKINYVIQDQDLIIKEQFNKNRDKFNNSLNKEQLDQLSDDEKNRMFEIQMLRGCSLNLNKYFGYLESLQLFKQKLNLHILIMSIIRLISILLILNIVLYLNFV